MSDTVKTDLGGLIKIIAHNRKMTDTQITQEAKMAQSAISIIKRKGNCTTNTLQKIFAALNVPLVIDFEGVKYELIDKI